MSTSVVQESKKTSGLTLSRMFKLGSIFMLDTHIWTGTVKMSAGDLGIQDTQDVKDALNLGTERLVPKELLAPLNNLRTQGNNVIREYSAEFNFLPGSRFVPSVLADPLEQVLKGLKKQFDDFVEVNWTEDNYNNKIKEQLEVTRKALLEATIGKPNSKEIVDVALARIRTKYPSLVTLKKRFRFDWARRSVNLPKDKAIDDMDLAEQEAQVVEDSMSGIIKDYAAKVNEIVERVKAMSSGDKKPTAATIKSIQKLKGQISQLTYMGCQDLLGVLDKLETFITNITTLQEVDKELAATQLKDGINGISEDLEKATTASIAASIEYLEKEIDLAI